MPVGVRFPPPAPQITIVGMTAVSTRRHVLAQKRRSPFAEPFLQVRLRLELLHVDVVDGWTSLPGLTDIRIGHLADPDDPMPLQAGMRKIDPFPECFVEIAATNQD